MSARLLFAAFFALLLPVGTVRAADNWGPWDVPSAGQKTAQESDASPLDLAVSNFQKYISPIDGARCPMYPTCSAYARQALRKHGTIFGVFLSVDRMIHEIDPLEQREPIVKWGFTRFYDPLSYNDFWLKETREE